MTAASSSPFFRIRALLPVTQRRLRTLCAGCLFLLPVAPILGSPVAQAGSDAPAGRRPLTVTMDDNYPPYVFRDSSGVLSGYLVDSWKLWEEKTGVPVNLQATDWDKAKQRMAAGQADVIDTIFRTAERERTVARRDI